MPAHMNVFATTEEDLYKNPFEQQKPKRSFDSLIEEFNSVRSAEATELRGQFWTLHSQIETLLAARKAEKLVEAEERFETAILESRKLKKAFEAAKEESFKALQVYTRLEGASVTASRGHEARVHEFRSKTLLTKSEKSEWATKIAASKSLAEKTFLAESKQQQVYNSQVRVEAEAGKAYVESVNAVNDLQREINRLSK